MTNKPLGSPYNAVGGRSVVDLPTGLRRALDAELDGYPARELGQAANRLSQRYRADHPAVQPILASALDTTAYLTTRMPATYAAARQVFDRLIAARPDFQPRTMLDLGAGTGACTLAAADAFPSLEYSHLVDGSTHALSAAQRLLEGSRVTVTTAATRVDRPDARAGAEHVDLVVCGFLLGELDNVGREKVITEMASTASVVAVIEAGTPAGYRRVLTARTALLAAGQALLAPCPHDDVCPLAQTEDWCHFAVRLTRSIRHRQAKGGQRGFEDEKYAYVVASSQTSRHRSARILRRPQIRTGHVRMTLCAIEPGVQHLTVSKRHGQDYRAAHHARWGDGWPPSASAQSGPDVSAE